MKNKIFRLLSLLVVVSFTLVSCDDSVEGTFYEATDGVNAAFASTVQVVEMVAADQGKILIPVYRGGNPAAEAEVELALTLDASVPAGTFALQSNKVKFPAGESETMAVITYADINALSPSATYKMTLTIANEEQLSPSKVEAITVTAQRKLTYSVIGTGTFESEFWEDSWTVNVEKAVEADVYRIKNCYFDGYPLIFAVASNNSISFVKQEIGYTHSTYGKVSFMMPTATYANQPYKEGKVFYLYGRFVVNAGSFGTFLEKLTLD